MPALSSSCRKKIFVAPIRVNLEPKNSLQLPVNRCGIYRVLQKFCYTRDASTKLVQRTNTWLNRVEFFYTYSCINGLCFGYFQIFPERSPFNQKLRYRYPLLPMYPHFLTII